jgi:hypothetical protein
MTGFACVWWFRQDILKGGRALVVKGILPFAGAVILALFFVKGVINDWKPVNSFSSWTLPFSPHWHIGGIFLIGVGSLILGVVLMEVYRYISPAYFKGQTLNKDTAVLVPDDGGTQ